MITKTQLAKKITEKAGLLPFDSHQFFEIFLTCLYNRLSLGEVIGSKSTGYFTVKNCIINSSTGISAALEDKKVTAPLILFSENSDFSKENKTLHYFVVPKPPEHTDDDISFHFNLSISKPQLGDSKLTDESFSQFKSGSEIAENFKSRAEILINTFEKFGKTSDDEVLILDIEEGKSTRLVEGGKEKIKTAQSGFTKFELSDKTQDSENDSFSGLPWDFGRKFFEKKVDYPEQERTFDTHKEDELTDELKTIHNEKIIEETVKEELSGKSFTKDEQEPEENFKIEDEIKNTQPDYYPVIQEIKSSRYERVRTFISSDMKIKHKETNESPASVNKEEVINDIQNQATDEFIPVKSKSETYHLIDKKKKRESRKFLNFSKESLDNLDSLYDIKVSEKRNWVMPAAISFAVVLILAGFVYIFLEKDSILTSEPKNIFIKVTPPPYVNVIERDYEFAVSFPYSRSETNNHISGIDPAVFKSGVKIVEQAPKPVEPKKEIKDVQKTEVKTIDKPETVLTERNKNISKYKDYYVVQVSAYRTYAAAEKEAEKYRDQGYNAFIEIAELPGKGTWYRIKVGDFTSIKHAEDFLIKNRNQ